MTPWEGPGNREKLLTVVVPCYNTATYLPGAVEPLLSCPPEVEVLLVNDGSTDDTADLADAYARQHPQLIRVIHKPNGGHGSAINAGLAEARGKYFKVLDSDDRLDTAALAKILDTLRSFEASEDIDVLVSNFVYEKVGRNRTSSVRYSDVFPEARIFGWEEVGRFRKGRYVMMHSLIYRTRLLHDIRLRLPEHTYYVDNLYVVSPLRHARKLFYVNVDLYRYSIGRDDQSVNEKVMTRRANQQLRVTRLVLRELPLPHEVPSQLYEYLLHHGEILCAITSLLLARSGGPEHLETRNAFWMEVRSESPGVYRRLRRGFIGHGSNLPTGAGRRVSLLAYQLVRRVVGFS